jgi:hypothetical protein
MKSKILHSLGQIIKFGLLLCAIQFYTTAIAVAQNHKWPVTIHGSEGGFYEGAPVINGYLIVNSKYLKGLIRRTYLKGSSLDTALNSDTLYGRIKLHLLSNPRHIDIELSKSYVVSVAGSYILTIVGTSFENQDVHIPMTRWIIFAPGKHSSFNYPPFGRLVAQKNNVLIYDSSDKDTVEGGYLCPMTLDNGHEEIEIFNRFRSTIGTLRKFIRKRYEIDLDLQKPDSKDAHFLINYIAEQENILLYKKKRGN